MAQFTRFTRFGYMHLVDGQDAKMFYDIACATTPGFKISTLIPEASCVTVEEQIYEGYGRCY